MWIGGWRSANFFSWNASAGSLGLCRKCQRGLFSNNRQRKIFVSFGRFGICQHQNQKPGVGRKISFSHLGSSINWFCWYSPCIPQADWCLKHNRNSVLLSDGAFRSASRYKFRLSRLFRSVSDVYTLRSVEKSMLVRLMIILLLIAISKYLCLLSI